MKKSIIIGLLIMSLYSTAQTNNQKDDDKSSVGVATPAKFKGGEAALQKYLVKNTKYPSLALENDIQGEVMVMFIVDKQGKVEDITVVSKKLGFGLDIEAMRVINSTNGMWIPASQKGKNVAMRFRMPIRFYIEPDKPKKKKRRKK